MATLKLQAKQVTMANGCWSTGKEGPWLQREPKAMQMPTHFGLMESWTKFQPKEWPRSVYNPKPREMREYGPINEANTQYKNQSLNREKGEVLH